MGLFQKKISKRKPPIIDPKTQGKSPSVTFKDLSDQGRWQAVFRASILSATTQKFFNYVNLADQKAQALIVLNSVLIPVALNWLEKPLFQIPVIITIITALFSILMAIVCIYPKRGHRRKKDGSTNYLHFGDIGRMKEQDFLDEFMPILNDLPQLAETSAKDLHDVAQRIIRPKFFWLRLSYLIFFLGNLGAISLTFYNFWLNGFQG